MVLVRMYETFKNRASMANHRREREYTRTFDLIFTEPDEEPAFVRLTPGLPRPWNPYVTNTGVIDLGSWCQEVRVQQDTTDPYLWRADAKYSNQLTRADINSIENPLLRPADIEWSGTEVMIPLEFDINGNPILNSAKDRFDPPPEIEDNRLVLTISRNQLLFDAAVILAYRGSINSQPFFGFPVGQVRCVDIKGTRALENGILHWKTTNVFHIRYPRYEGEEARFVWQFRLLNRGFYELAEMKDGSRKKRPIRVAGRPASTPQLLSPAGQQVPPEGVPNWLTFEGRRSMDFNNLYLV